MTLTLERPTRKVHHWTPEDLDLVKQKYDGTSETTKVLEQLIGASHAAIKQKAIILGITRRQRPERAWTEEEIDKLEKLTPLYSPYKVGEMLKRTVHAIRAKQNELKFSPLHREWYYLVEVAKITGIHLSVLTRLVNSGKLKAQRYGANDKRWQIRPQDLKLFIMRYPGELQGRKCEMVTIVDLLTNVKADGK
jgi:hypothetical protein